MLDMDVDAVTLVYVKGVLADLVLLDSSQFKKEFHNFVEKLQETPKESMPSQETRNKIASLLPEAYFNKMGEYPAVYDLNGLSNYCLLDYLKSIHKKKSDENSFHSDKQAQRRSAREYLVSTNDSLMDFLYSKYTLQLDSLSKVNNMEVEG